MRQIAVIHQDFRFPDRDSQITSDGEITARTQFYPMHLKIGKRCRKRWFFQQQKDFKTRILTQRTGDFLGLRKCRSDQTHSVSHSCMRQFKHPGLLL